MSWRQQKYAGISTNVLGDSRNVLESAQMCWRQQKYAGISTNVLESAEICWNELGDAAVGIDDDNT